MSENQNGGAGTLSLKRPFSLDAILFILFAAITAESRGLAVFLPALLIYLLAGAFRERWPGRVYLLKLMLIYLCGISYLFGVAAINIAGRREGDLNSKTHDGMIQTEAAADYVLAGVNPYGADYSRTEMNLITAPVTPNPAYHHFVYLPGIALLTAPYKAALTPVLESTLGFYDQRFLYIPAFLILLLILPTMAGRREDRLGLAMAAALNFSGLRFLAEGRNDTFGLTFVVLGFYFLAERRRLSVASLFIGIACTLKHSFVFMVPFFALYAVGQSFTWERVKRTVLAMWPLPAVIAAAFLPFFLADPAQFYEDVFLYLNGSIPDGFPIVGFNFGNILVSFGFIASPRALVSFSILQIGFGLLAFAGMLYAQWRSNTMGRAFIGYAVFAMVLGFFARYLTNNVISIALTCLLIGTFARPKWDRARAEALP